MKNNKLLIAVIIVFIKTNMVAHGLLSVWSNCNANNGNNGNNYRSYAAAWCGAAYTNQAHANCNANTALANVQVYGWVSQQAQCGPNLAYLYGWTKNRRPCNRGEATLAQFLNYPKIATVEDGYEEQMVSAANIDRTISPNIIKINNLNGTITNNCIDYASHVSIHVWKPSNINDNAPTAANSIYVSSIHYVNGEMTLDNFPPDNVVFNYDPTTAKGDISFNINQIIIDIHNIDPTLNGNDYVVSIVSDAYDISTESAKMSVKTTEEKIAQNVIVFDAAPNPTADQLKVTFKNNQSSNVVVSSVLLFNSLGKLVQEIPADKFTNTNDITIELKEREKGMYYLLIIDSDNKRYCKKIIKE